MSTEPNLSRLSLADNQLTGDIPAELGDLSKSVGIWLAGNTLTGCVPAALQIAADNDLARMGLPFCGVPQAQQFSASQLETLFDEIISKTEQREAFSPIKESNIGFSALEEMKKLRAEFVASTTQAELYYALWKLSNVRRDTHLGVWPTEGGLEPPLRSACVSASIHVLPDLSDINNPTFFVARVDHGLTSPTPGDIITGVNGRSMAEYTKEITPWIRHSSLPGLYWYISFEMTKRYNRNHIPVSLYRGRLDLTLERPSGQRYDVSLPYREGCDDFTPYSAYTGFVKVMERVNFNVWVHGRRQIILLEWLDFEKDDLIMDIPTLMEYAQREQLLGYNMIIDVSRSGGGSGGAYAIQRLVDRPFHVTFGNVRLSDRGKWLVEYFAEREVDTNAPDIFGLNLSGSWLIDWARTDAMEAMRRGDEYTPPVPFKLAHLPKDSDGILRPAPVHFKGEVVIINGKTFGGSHLDQFVAMFVDNDLALFIGVPTGGFSNTWEGRETLRMPETGRPLVRFMWNIGHRSWRATRRNRMCTCRLRVTISWTTPERCSIPRSLPLIHEILGLFESKGLQQNLKDFYDVVPAEGSKNPPETLPTLIMATAAMDAARRICERHGGQISPN